jgi:lysozyme
MEIRTLDQRGRAFLAQEEGIKLKPYRDSKGIPTIGIGCTFYPDGRRVTMQDKPLRDIPTAWQLFDTVNEMFLLTVYSTTRDDINQNQFNALLSLCYSIGPGEFKGSTVLRLVNENPNNPEISTAFRMWRYVTIEKDGKVIRVPELLPRRNREVDMYFSNPK